MNKFWRWVYSVNETDLFFVRIRRTLIFIKEFNDIRGGLKLSQIEVSGDGVLRANFSDIINTDNAKRQIQLAKHFKIEVK